MNTIDKIRAEIKKRRLHFNKEAEKYQALNNGYSQNCYGARDALRDLENFIDTLEEPVSEDLEEELENYYGSIPDDDDKINAARHFAKWGAEHLADASKMISEDLEKKTFDDYIKASPAERRKMNMTEILGEERLAKTKERMDLEEAAEEYNKQVIEETKCHHNALTYAEGYEDALLLIPDAFKAGAE